MNRLLLLQSILICALLFAASGCASNSASNAKSQQTFASPDAAMVALLDALRHHDKPYLKHILGPDGDAILSSGDPVADRADAERFIELYNEDHSISPDNGSGAQSIIVGKNSWPFPVPIVKSGRKFVFDTKTGREEILNRRIGRNELSAEQVCLAIVDAQRDYVARHLTNSDLPEYAQKLVSDRGRKNGLYWPTSDGEEPSPLGPLVASAAAEGYGEAAKGSTTRPTRPAYHGYRYRLLTAQGSHASGGAFEYLVNGHLIGGFGVVAYPAQYGNSGITTFITNHNGIVYQRDLGPETEQAAEAMKAFDPGPGWTKADDSSPEVAQRD